MFNGPHGIARTECHSAVSSACGRPRTGQTTREGKRFLGYYIEPLRHKEIKQTALDAGIQIQELLHRAFDAWMDANSAEAVAAVERRTARRAGR